AVRRLVLRVLGDADNDRGASGVCVTDCRLHPDRHSARRARFTRGARGGVCGVPPTSADARPPVLRQEEGASTDCSGSDAQNRGVGSFIDATLPKNRRIGELENKLRSTQPVNVGGWGSTHPPNSRLKERNG